MSQYPTSKAEHAAPVREPRRFGKRAEPSSITITRNGKSHEFAVSPLAVTLVFGIFAMFATGYFSATAYLMLRDDLIGMTQARNARLLHEYEDRIATLRANLDKVTSRQLLDQQAIEAKVSDLMKRQEMLGGRDSRIGRLVDEAKKRGLGEGEAPEAIDPAATGSIPGSGKQASLGTFELRGAAGSVAGEEKSIVALDASLLVDINNPLQTRDMFRSVNEQIAAIDLQQRDMLDGLRREAMERSQHISGVLEKLGVQVDRGEAVGGPFIPLSPNTAFEAHVEALDQSLKTLDEVSALIDRQPVGNPAKGSPLSSPFGVRTDPFLGHPAMHSGLDFKAETGTPVRAAASGKVVDAGRNGGYGSMVEIDHGNGVSTRYAHLSKILISTGDKIERGTIVGEVGSTGRSTGPHLHYEIRKHGNAVNPATYLKAGRSIANFL